MPLLSAAKRHAHSPDLEEELYQDVELERPEQCDEVHRMHSQECRKEERERFVVKEGSEKKEKGAANERVDPEPDEVEQVHIYAKQV